jgi:Gamma-glutamylcysteine synthetase
VKLSEKIKKHILSKSVSKSQRRIGIEVECFVYKKNFNRIAVNKSDEYSATDLLNELNNINNDVNGTYSLEPGGQIEWSSPPCDNMFELDDALSSHKHLLDSILIKRNLLSLYIGVDPFTDPDSIELIDQKKYQLMNINMEKRGTLGKWMMRNTSSIQVNYDIIDQRDLEEVMFIADCIHPISAYLFAHSPFQLGRPVRSKNLRNYIWENTDNTRCRSLRNAW